MVTVMVSVVVMAAIRVYKLSGSNYNSNQIIVSGLARIGDGEVTGC